MSTPVLALTTGEPAGIGPELVVKLAAEMSSSSVRLVAVGDPAMLVERAALTGVDIDIQPLALGQDPARVPAGSLPVWPVTLRRPSQPGHLLAANADYVIETLDVAIAACRHGQAQGMVTAPVHKGIIIDGGHVGFTGHTEYLRDACDIDEVVMMLATHDPLHARDPCWQGKRTLRVALATTHLPLRDVAEAIRPESLARVVRILHTDLQRHFGIASPRILVCGLNPHAGEDGHLGREEIEVITPTLSHLRAQGVSVFGPLPADTLFTPRYLAETDAVLAMYHDQGLAVLKYAGFGRGANITLGLPIIRTSVDHGTALDLAGTGCADTGSLAEAVMLARSMVTHAF
ncbi:4-hydroxythreonine-4-phosphate dehydrogenase PdxA [Aidingimonas lacisalsi]|uniref:4-hydroxythreonine-4-phosphate dehydrogenase PdxA n=1 Tax=Aidingimonas lacisalsi TaxID=2604086 RepID=UPI0011D1D144|nr:4-hydroxythreonine-4-phosphate dehydrogenase PdxA [Aidingimonas lacisalsi]